MSFVDHDAVAEILQGCTDRYVLPRYRQLQDSEISTKTGPNDLVTQADIDVEAHLQRVLPQMIKGSIFVGEEGVSNGSISLDVLHTKDAAIWIADPVDGTYNFVNGKREFAVMLGLIINGVIEYGWIYDCLSGELTQAERGQGAYCNGERLRVARQIEISDMSGHINARYFPDKYREHINAMQAKFQECRSLACAGHEHLRLAKGEVQFSVYSRHKPWDHVPGSLIVQEAGGYVGHWDGAEYDFNRSKGGIIAASSKELAKQVYNFFIP